MLSLRHRHRPDDDDQRAADRRARGARPAQPAAGARRCCCSPGRRSSGSGACGCAPRPLWSQAWRNLATSIGALAVALLLVLAVFADLSATMRNHRTLRYLINPLNSFYALAFLAHAGRGAAGRAARGRRARRAARAEAGRDARRRSSCSSSARRRAPITSQLNGYARPTNPELSQRKVVSFGDVTSCGTNTAASLPCMFSSLGRAAFDAHKGAQENLLDVAQRAGPRRAVARQPVRLQGPVRARAACGGGRARAGVPPPAAGLCHDGECYDEALLAGLDAAARRAARRAPGARRAAGAAPDGQPRAGLLAAFAARAQALPARMHEPTCCSSATAQAIVNAYDNTIAYTDHVLAGAIDWLGRQSAQYDAALLYVSDHGESLGENNLYLHGLPYAFAPREQKHVPMIVWLGAAGRGRPSRSPACASGATPRCSHDNLFHSALGLPRRGDARPIGASSTPSRRAGSR